MRHHLARIHPLLSNPRIRRLGGYAAWTAVGAIIPLTIDRLIVHPILNRELGADTFGAFIWVLGLVNLFGSSGAMGFSTLLMRDYAKHPGEQRQLLYRCSLLLTFVLSIAIIGLAMFGSIWFADETVQAHQWPLYVTLGLFGILRALSQLLITNLRIKRRFRTIFFMRLLEAAVLCANVAIAPIGSLWLVGCVYIGSMLAMLPFGASRVSDVNMKGQWWEGKAARWLLAGWYAGAMINIINMSQVYLARLIVGVFIDSAEVAVIYAGVAMGSVFLLPVNVMSNLALSLLGGKTTFVFGSTRGVAYLGATAVLGAIVGLASWFIGRWLVTLLYPDLAARTLEFYHWIALANAFQVVMLLLRPAALKYAPLLSTTGLTAAALGVQVIALVLLVPDRGAYGAAIAIGLAAAASAVLWISYFLWLLRAFARRGL